MTVVLSFLDPGCVIQVSDRLVSRGGTPYDQGANKCIVYICADAIVTIGYSGVAFIHGQATDEWIAEQLWGDRFDRTDDGLVMAHLGGPERRRSIEESVLHLLAQLTALNSIRPYPLFVTGAGWNVHEGRAVPAYFFIQKFMNELPTLMGDSIARLEPQSWMFIDTAYQLMNRPHLGDFFKSILRRIERRPDIDRHGAVENLLLRIARMVSAADPNRVGPHLLSISMPLMMPPIVRARYFPLGKQPLKKVLFQGTCLVDPDLDGTDGIIFSPWVVGRDSYFPPAIISGGAPFMETSGVRIEIEGMQPAQQRPNFIYFGLPQRP